MPNVTDREHQEYLDWKSKQNERKVNSAAKREATKLLVAKHQPEYDALYKSEQAKA